MDKTSKETKHVEGLNFVRTFATLGIVAFHTSGRIEEGSCAPFVNMGRNVEWGPVCVAIFFILSGFLTHHINKDQNWKNYCAKRAKAIFPMFYICFLFFYILKVIEKRTLFYCGKWELLLSVTGMDGYTLYLHPNYYEIGEWFLGAIIIMYLLYLPIRKLLEWNRWSAGILVIGLFVWLMIFNPFQIWIFRNPIVCCFCFVSGIYIEKFDVLKSRIFKALSLVIAIIVLFIELPVSNVLIAQVMGIALFACLHTIGVYVEKMPFAKDFVGVVNRLSYAVFLVHHKLIYYALERYQPESMKQSLLLTVGILFVSLFYAELLYACNKSIMSRWRKRAMDDNK